MSGVRVNSRAELEAYLRANPLLLRAARLPRPPRVGHPEFIGPFQPHALNRSGTIRFGADGSPEIILTDPPRARVWPFQRSEAA